MVRTGAVAMVRSAESSEHDQIDDRSGARAA